MRYYPIPYEDEILYSQIARMFGHTLEQNISQSLKRFFDDKNYKATIDLPNRLNTLFNKHYYQIESSVDQIIQKYTLYPFYEHFLRNDKRPKILNYLKEGSGSLIHVIAGINGSKVKRNRYPRFCPQCIVEASTQYHESYWRRVHQIPRVLVCPIHNVFLNEYKPSIDELNHSMFISAERLSGRALSSIKNRNNTLLVISKVFDDLLNYRADFDINTIDYKEKIKTSPYMKGSNINYSLLIDDAIKYYGDDALTTYFPEYTHPLQWVPSIVRRPITYVDPVKHLLLTSFLDNMEYKAQLFVDPVWDGPWKCVNGVCKHYGKPNIKVADVFFDNRLKRTAAIVKCECGMIYKMSFALRNSIRIQSITIKDYGELWRTEALRLQGIGKSINSIANTLHTDFRTVSRFLLSQQKPVNNIRDLKFQNELILNRNEWKVLLESFKESKIVNARKADSRLYKWLYNNDLSWLQITNKLYSSQPRPHGLKLEWDRIDEELVYKISLAFDTLKSKDFKGRITKSIISKLINKEKNFISLNISKLPKSGALLENIIESNETYQIRRLEASKNELLEKDESVTCSKVIRNSKLKSVTDSRVLKFLEDEVRRYQFV